MKKKEWLEKKKKSIGGSEAAAILGMNPYCTNVELWELKTGRRKKEDISGKSYVQYGIEAEKPLIELFRLDYPQYEVITNENENEYDLKRHPEYPFMVATLDGEIIDTETGRKGILEIKTTNILQSMQREKWNDRIPENYFVQLLHYFLVTGYEFAILKAHLKSIWEGEVRITQKHYMLERANYERDIEYLKDEEIRFWTCVENDIKPDLKLPQI